MSGARFTIPAARWPMFAAAFSALVGMGSCGLSAMVPPFALFVAPVVAWWLTSFVFEVVVALRPASGTQRERQERSDEAALTAWAVSIIVCSAWGLALERVFSRSIGKEDLGVTAIGVITGVVLGGVVAYRIRRVARAHHGLDEAGGG